CIITIVVRTHVCCVREMALLSHSKKILIQQHKEKFVILINRRIGVILRVADVFVYDENNGSGFIAENSGNCSR
ncbi:hypothetical protein L9F63_018763, partial [Diploptera punctata]